MKKTLSILAILAMTATACNKVEITPNNGEPVPEVKMVYETISGSSGSSTKATIADSDAAFSWTENDHIAVHVSNGESHKYVFTSDAGASGASETAATASFTVTYEAGYALDAFAVFPSTIVSASAANYGQDGYTLDVTLPDSYTLAQVSSTTTPCPMIADNTGDSWAFKQLCGMLRLTVNGIPADATGMVIQFPGKKVNGAFTIASPVTPGTSEIETGAPADGEDQITITFDAGITSATVNIPLPTGDYEDVLVTPVGSATKVAATRFIKAGGYTATRARAKKLTTTMVSFSVSATKKVFFAPGNLVKTDATYTVGSGNESYAFETTPFNTNGGSLGYDQGAPTSTSARGYFTWGEIATADETPRVFTVNGVSGWKALTYDECDYLQLYRAMNASVHRFYRIDLGSSGTQVGFLIPPDGATSADVAGLTEPMSASGSITENVNVDTYISKGFVFLPAVGWYPTSWYEYWNDGGNMGYYWTTTTDGDYYYRYFYKGGQGDDYGPDDYYCSVRLVRE